MNANKSRSSIFNSPANAVTINNAVTTTFRNWMSRASVIRSKRSAIYPASGLSKTTGTKSANPITPSHQGDFVNSQVSHPIARRWAQTPHCDGKLPMANIAKFRCEKAPARPPRLAFLLFNLSKTLWLQAKFLHRDEAPKRNQFRQFGINQ